MAFESVFDAFPAPKGRARHGRRGGGSRRPRGQRVLKEAEGGGVVVEGKEEENEEEGVWEQPEGRGTLPEDVDSDDGYDMEEITAAAKGMMLEGRRGKWLSGEDKELYLRADFRLVNAALAEIPLYIRLNLTDTEAAVWPPYPALDDTLPVSESETEVETAETVIGNEDRVQENVDDEDDDFDAWLDKVSVKK